MSTTIVKKLVPYIRRVNSDVKHNLKIDAISSVSFGVFAGAFYPFFAVVAVRLGAAGTLLALITAAPYMGQLFAVYWGHRSDQNSKKLPFVVYGGMISRILIIVLAFTRDVNFFALLVILHFLFASISGPAYTSLIRKIYPIKYRGQILGGIQFIIGMVRVGVTYIAGIWLDSHGFTPLFLAAGLAGILTSTIYTKIKEPHEGENERRKFSLGKSMEFMKSDKLLRIAITGFFIFELGNLLLAPVYPFVQVNILNLTNSQIARLSIFWIMGWFSTAPYWGWLIDRYQPRYTILISIILFTGAPLIYFLGLPYPALMLASFLNGAAGSSLQIGWVNLMMKLGGKNSSQYSGIYLTMLGIRGVLGPLLGNLLSGIIDIRYIFLVAIVLILSGLIPIIFLGKNEKKLQEC